MSTYTYGDPSPFPPSYENDPWSYGFGLAGDLIASALCLAMLLTYLFERRRMKRVSHRVGIPPPLPIPRWSVFWVYRAFNVNVLLFIVMRALPDAVWMLLWGEVEIRTIEMMLLLDLYCDGLALVPLFFAILCWAWGRQSIPQSLLSERGGGRMAPPTWQMIGRNGMIVVLVLVISVGVTVGKVYGV